MPDVLSRIGPVDASRWFLFACLMVSSLYVGRVVKDQNTARDLIYAAMAVAGYSGLASNQKVMASEVKELHKAVNSQMTAKDARMDAATDAATSAAKVSADTEAETAAERLKAVLARNADLERQLKELREGTS